MADLIDTKIGGVENKEQITKEIRENG